MISNIIIESLVYGKSNPDCSFTEEKTNDYNSNIYQKIENYVKLLITFPIVYSYEKIETNYRLIHTS